MEAPDPAEREWGVPPSPAWMDLCAPVADTSAHLIPLGELVQLSQAPQGEKNRIKRRCLGICWHRELNQLAKGS